MIKVNVCTICINHSVPLCSDSPLRAELIPKTSRPAKKTTGSGLTARRHLVHDQPLTFHSKVKSSGYTAQPRYALQHSCTSISSPLTGAECLFQRLAISQDLLTKNYPVH